MAVKIEEREFAPFGKCLSLSNSCAELLVSLDFGPRILSYRLLDGENVLGPDIEGKLVTEDPSLEEYYGEGTVWRNRGGHRLWVSPEAMPQTYYPDNDPVAYEQTEQGVIFTPPAQRKNNWQYAVTVSMAEDSSQVSVTQRVINLGETRKAGVWSISVMDKGGFEVIPQPDRPTGLLENRVFAVWPYSDMADPRVCWGTNYITLKQEPSASGPFKIGVNNEHGWAAYFNKGCCFVKRFTHQMGAEYPDGGMSFETYTCPDFIEIESLSPYYTLKTGEWMEHTEHWELKKAGSCDPRDQKAVAELVKETGLV